MSHYCIITDFNKTCPNENYLKGIKKCFAIRNYNAMGPFVFNEQISEYLASIFYVYLSVQPVLCTQ